MRGQRRLPRATLPPSQALARPSREMSIRAPARSHKDYVKCVLGAVKDAVKAKTLSKECARAVHKCAAKSTCGTSGYVLRDERQGHDQLQLKRDATACKAPHGGSSCVSSHPSCCDACGTSGCAP